MTTTSPGYHEGQRQGTFYAQSWALVHWLMEEDEERLGEYKKTENSHRKFCTECGSAVLIRHPALGLTAPRNAGVEDDTSMPLLGRYAVRVSWDTAYAGDCPIECYEILRNGDVLGTVPHQPQYSHRRFFYDDVFEGQTEVSSYRYQVVAVDASSAPQTWVAPRSEASSLARPRSRSRAIISGAPTGSVR